MIAGGGGALNLSVTSRPAGDERRPLILRGTPRHAPVEGERLGKHTPSSSPLPFLPGALSDGPSAAARSLRPLRGPLCRDQSRDATAALPPPRCKRTRARKEVLEGYDARSRRALIDSISISGALRVGAAPIPFACDELSGCIAALSPDDKMPVELFSSALDPPRQRRRSSEKCAARV